MDTEIMSHDDLSAPVSWLKSGEPVVFPTETVYGLGACVFCESSIQKIFKIKGRPIDNPLIAHIASFDQAQRLSDDLSPSFHRLADHFWPGPLTIVVRRRFEVPSLVSAGHPTIAIRMPSHPIARALITGVGEPLAAPSANLSGRPSPTCVKDVVEDLGGKVKYVIDGGPCKVGIESTVISLFGAQPTLLRPGHISRHDLEAVLGEKVILPSKNGPILSPGMKYRHYAPKAPIRLVYKEEDLMGCYIQPTPQSLYAQLRAADRAGASEIQIYCDPQMQKDEALMNRLLRAAGQID